MTHTRSAEGVREQGARRDGTALVVGGTRGIGRAVCLALAPSFQTVAVMYRQDEAAADAVARDIVQLGAKAQLLKADIRDADLVATLIGRLTGDPRLDLLVHSAGARTQWAPIRDMQSDDWRAYLDNDLNGFFNVVSPVLKIMHNQRSGNIVAITSISARAASPFSGQSAAAKAGVEAMIRVIAREEGRHGIRANAVAAGLTDTEQGHDAIRHWGRETAERIIAQSALSRMGTAAEVAQVVAFLASPAASYVTGRTLAADGGQFISG
ncbi:MULTISPECIES: SDR family NAD(P)-dependent oxidoreductase [unclassified Chelatococcus]|uniref:SDR family oxidoreductase n=1 Tax=unclassified Chelatococcus TaxID=2638111 RepID=UPI001BCB0AFC|nr:MULTISPECIES: SDR family NAD(P)-dependent oxidoreductase [unclassified Chelatococcus]MBS7701225.1 SDR family oxidoreductase [Chelatococcus sp. YT9]MBX3557356.1 SDR family oxidoreductase [Chelatococcus sp.]